MVRTNKKQSRNQRARTYGKTRYNRNIRAAMKPRQSVRRDLIHGQGDEFEVNFNFLNRELVDPRLVEPRSHPIHRRLPHSQRKYRTLQSRKVNLMKHCEFTRPGQKYLLINRRGGINADIPLYFLIAAHGGHDAAVVFKSNMVDMRHLGELNACFRGPVYNRNNRNEAKVQSLEKRYIDVLKYIAENPGVQRTLLPLKTREHMFRDYDLVNIGDRNGTPIIEYQDGLFLYDPVHKVVIKVFSFNSTRRHDLKLSVIVKWIEENYGTNSKLLCAFCTNYTGHKKFPAIPPGPTVSMYNKFLNTSEFDDIGNVIPNIGLEGSVPNSNFDLRTVFGHTAAEVPHTEAFGAQPHGFAGAAEAQPHGFAGAAEAESNDLRFLEDLGENIWENNFE